MSDVGAEREPVDFRRIQETSDGDTDFEKELFNVFLEDCGERLTLLETALEKGDVNAVHLEAHTIKGAGSNVGTTLLHEIAARIEKSDDSVLAESGATMMAELREEFGRTKNSISAYLDGL